jgi:mannan endo-1,4-beta-mannosidase
MINPRIVSLVVVLVAIHYKPLVDAADTSTLSRLTVKHSQLLANGSAIFLNGVNQAWQSYGNDFGNNPPPSTAQALYTTLAQIQQAGGNAVRMWVHCGGSVWITCKCLLA